MVNPNVAPAVTIPSPNEWPSTILTISGISNASQAQITSIAHPFTTDDIGVTTVMPLLVKGMRQINGIPGVIQGIFDADNITVNINSTSFSTYDSGGQLSIVTGQPARSQVGSQFFNTPFANVFDTGAT
jgi:hypothetical protein